MTRSRLTKLQLNVDDNQYFSDIIVKSSAPTPIHPLHERLKSAAQEATKHVRSIVASLDEKDHGDLLNAWVTYIEHKALVVLLRVPDDADAYKMFETLNDRGLRTSQADLIKNYLIGRSGSRTGEVQSRWAYMRGALESLDDDDITTVTFLRHALIVLRGYVREAEVYDVVQELVRSEQAAVTFTGTLEALANSYVASFNPEHAQWSEYPDKARRAIEVFNLLDIRPMRPLILACLSKMTKANATASFEFLISLGVRLLLASTTRSGSVELPLAEVAHSVHNQEVTNAKELSAKLLSITPTDIDFEQALQAVRVSNARLARYYLRSLETSAVGESEPWFMPNDDRSIITLEHVLPKKPGTAYPSFSDEAARSYVNRLGNLALLRASDNSGARSDAFPTKVAAFAQSPYLLTREVAQATDWDIAAITHRQLRLAALGPATWPIRT